MIAVLKVSVSFAKIRGLIPFSSKAYYATTPDYAHFKFR